VELYLHSPSAPSWRGAQLKKAQGQLYLYLYLHIYITDLSYIEHVDNMSLPWGIFGTVGSTVAKWWLLQWTCTMENSSTWPASAGRRWVRTYASPPTEFRPPSARGSSLTSNVSTADRLQPQVWIEQDCGADIAKVKGLRCCENASLQLVVHCNVKDIMKPIAPLNITRNFCYSYGISIAFFKVSVSRLGNTSWFPTGTFFFITMSIPLLMPTQLPM
jgi:hypothetical protein